MLPEDDAGDMRAMLASGAAIGDARDQRFHKREVSSAQAGMGSINRPVQNGDADLANAERFRPKIADSRKPGANASSRRFMDRGREGPPQRRAYRATTDLSGSGQSESAAHGKERPFKR